MSNCYVYVLCDPNRPGYFKFGRWVFHNEPFYAGKGKGNRAFEHLAGRSACNNAALDRRIASIQRKGLDPLVVFKRKRLTDSEALTLEKILIAKIGRKVYKEGPLLNLVAGGGNGGNHYPGRLSEDTLEYLSETSRAAKKAYWENLSDADRKRVGKNIRAGQKKALAVLSAKEREKKELERRRKISEYWKNNPDRLKETRAKAAESVHQLYQNNPTLGKKRSRAMKAFHANLSVRERNSRNRAISEGRRA